VIGGCRNATSTTTAVGRHWGAVIGRRRERQPPAMRGIIFIFVRCAELFYAPAFSRVVSLF